MEQLLELLRKQLDASRKREDKRAVAEAKREKKWVAAEAKRHTADLKQEEKYAATTQALLARIKAFPSQQLKGAVTPLNTGLAQERIIQSLCQCIDEVKFDPDNDVVKAIKHQTKKPQLKPGRGEVSASMSIEVSGSKPPGVCWNCGKEGLNNANCAFKNNKCCECGAVGHKDGRCFDKREFQPQVGKIVIQGIGTMQNVERNYADVFIHGVEVKLLADSGSDLTMTTHADWMKMGQPTLTPCPDANAVNGTSLRLYGYFDTKFCCTLASRNGSGMCYISDDIRVMGRGWLNQAIPEYLQSLMLICAPIKRKPESEVNATSIIAELQGEQREPPPDAHRSPTREARQTPSPQLLRRSTRIIHKLRKLDLDQHKASCRPIGF
uniref:Peptidase A2 domain-containing protein n=1 Tax=Plectus sambesii TaxID=2011161 RepID=A0A914WUM9_9BILA